MRVCGSAILRKRHIWTERIWKKMPESARQDSRESTESVAAVGVSGGLNIMAEKKSSSPRKFHLNAAFRRRWEELLRKSQMAICKEIEAMEEGHIGFREDVWSRGEHGGGGRTRVLQDGNVFEKASVNISAVYGDLPAEAATTMTGQDFTKFLTASIAQPLTPNDTPPYMLDEMRLYAAGLSLVIHPRNPMAPTVHMNYRLLQIFAKKTKSPSPVATSQQNLTAESENLRPNALTECSAAVPQDSSPQGNNSFVEHEHDLSVLWWFGGGTDLSPAYPFEEDCRHFHQMLREQCDRCDPLYYSRFKRWCDAYFRNHHRDESRGIGGIFFDRLNEDMTVNPEKFFRFAEDGLQRTFLEAYLPLVRKRKGSSFTSKEKIWQQLRRGRYAEFNLVCDRGTRFGFTMPGSRIESILCSLPLTARWEYDHKVEEDSPEAAAMAIFKYPKDWVAINEKALIGFTVPSELQPTQKL